MKTTVVIVLIALVLLGECSAAKLRSKQKPAKKADVKTELNKLIGSSDFSDHIVQSILLSMTKGTATEEVIKLITEAINNTVLQHTNLNNEKRAKLEVIDTEISQINGKLSTYRTEHQNTLTTIAQLNGDIKALERTITAITGEINLLRERKNMIIETRKQDVENFKNRQERDTNAIKALETIIPLLEEMVAGGSFVQKSQKEIDAALAKIPKNHPIEALVQMSTKFNEAKLKTVIGKLKDILEAVKASKADDELREGQSEGRFKALILEVDGLLDRKSARLVTTKGNKSTKEIELNNQENQRDTLEEQIKNEETNLKNAQELRDVTEANYNQRIKDTKEAIDALKRAKGIIEGNEKKLTDQEADMAAQAGI